MLLFYLHFFVIWTGKETKNGTVGQEAQVFSLGTTLSDDEFNFFFFLVSNIRFEGTRFWLNKFSN